jgi:hypothetical protein
MIISFFFYIILRIEQEKLMREKESEREKFATLLTKIYISV